MSWVLVSASDRFIDGPFVDKGEAESARRKCGITGAKVKSGRVPHSRVLATQIGDVDPEFKSVDAFVKYLDDDDRAMYTTEELESLSFGTRASMKALGPVLRARGKTPEFRKTAEAAKHAVKAPVRGITKMPSAPTGWAKPLPESERTKARRVERTRLMREMGKGGYRLEALEKLEKRAFKDQIPKLSKDQLTYRDKLIKALQIRYRGVLLRVNDFNDAVAEQTRSLAAAVEEYNRAVQTAQVFIEDLKNGATSYLEDRSDAWQEANGDAFNAWVDDLSVDLPELEEPEEFERDPGDFSDEAIEMLTEMPEGPSL